MAKIFDERWIMERKSKGLLQGIPRTIWSGFSWLCMGIFFGLWITPTREKNDECP